MRFYLRDIFFIVFVQFLRIFCYVQEVAAASVAKRPKIDVALISEEVETTANLLPAFKLPELIELSESFIAERLSVEIATDLVMDSMVCIMNYMLIHIYVKFKLLKCILFY